MKKIIIKSFLLLAILLFVFLGSTNNVSKASTGNPTDGFYVDNNLVKSYAKLAKMPKKEMKAFIKSSARSTKPIYVVLAGNVYKFTDVISYTTGKQLNSQTVAEYGLKNGKLNDSVDSHEFEVISID